MNSTVYSLLLCSLAVLVLSQELTEDAPSDAMDKRARFAFAKRFAFSGPSRNFAFAKRSASPEVDSAADLDGSDLMEKRARFAFAKRFAFNGPSSRSFAFAKRASFA